MTTDEVVGDAEVGESIARQAGRGLKWSLLGTLLTKIGSFAMGLVLARLLAPEDFGQYAIALAALGVLMHINDLGLIAATVQWRGKLEEMAPTAAVLAAGFGIAIYGVFWLAAPAFAAAAGDSGAAPVVRILTLIIVIDGLTAVRSGALMRNFQQKELIIANGLGFVVNAALSIYLAAKGNGAYSFAWGQLAGAFATGVLVCVLARVPLRISVDRAIAKRLMHFGVPLAASLGVDAVITNVQLMIVGHLTGPTALGYFLLAFNISSWAQTILGTAIRYVSVAGFSRLSEHDDEALSAGVRASMSVLVTVVAPIVALMSALATPLVVFLYGHSWSPAAPVLRILVVLTLARMMTRLAMDVLDGRRGDPGSPVVQRGLGDRAGPHAVVRDPVPRSAGGGHGAGGGRVLRRDPARRGRSAAGTGGRRADRPGDHTSPVCGPGGRRDRVPAGPVHRSVPGRATPCRWHRRSRGLPAPRRTSRAAEPVARPGRAPRR